MKFLGLLTYNIMDYFELIFLYKGNKTIICCLTGKVIALA
jgi:hypothetical protein